MRLACSRGLCVLFVLAALVVVAACGGSSAPATAFPSLPSGDVVITAKGTQFTTQDVHVPANTPWTLAFDNQDGLPHNVIILSADNKAVFTGTLVSGPKLSMEPGPALAAGTYHFTCAVHAEMHGILTVP
jgi:plastocyanin